MKMKTWEDLTPPQKEHVIKLASEAGIPMTNTTNAVFHTRGDFVSGGAWQFMKAWGGYAGIPQLDKFAIAAAPTEHEARNIIRASCGDCQSKPLDELFVVAGIVQPVILKVI